MRQRLAGTLLTLPAIVLFGLFVIGPALYALLLGFTDRHLLMPGEESFIGLTNFIDVAKSGLFRTSLKNTVIFTIAVVFLQTGLALLLAVLIDRKLRLTNLYRSAFFAPTITSMVVVSVLWAFLLNPSVGMINGMLARIGIAPQPFLTSEGQALWVIVGVSVWQGLGMQMMIFLAGLQDIPEDLYEAARIDGIGSFAQFTHITWPLLRNTTIFVVITTSIYAFKLFVQPFVMTQGGPNGATRSLVMYIYEQGFIAQRAGFSSAAAVIFFMIVLGISLVQRSVIKERRYYD